MTYVQHILYSYKIYLLNMQYFKKFFNNANIVVIALFLIILDKRAKYLSIINKFLKFHCQK